MQRKASLEKEKKNLANFLPKALIEEINKTYDDKNQKKSSLPLKEKDLHIKSNPNKNGTSINGNHNGFSMNNKNLNFPNGSYQNMNISQIFMNKLNVNNIHSESFINSNSNGSDNFSQNQNNYLSNAIYNNVDINLKKYLNEMSKMNEVDMLKNGKNGINGNFNINGINGINGNRNNQPKQNNIHINGNGFTNGKNGFKNNNFFNNINQINFNSTNMINNNTIYENINQINNNSFLGNSNSINNSININFILPNENSIINKGNYQYNNSNNINTINNNYILNSNIQLNNPNFNIINENELSHSFNSNNLNNNYNKLNLNNMNNIHFNNNIKINNINKSNDEINILNNKKSIINNENTINGNMELETSKNISETDIMDPQIEEIFSEIYNLPSDKSQILYLINKKGSDFFVKLIKTHKGSKCLQKMLSNNKLKEYEVNFVTDIICKNFLSIICDYYGNYFLQKFFKCCSNKNRLDIYKYIKPNFKQIANDICGNHSLQCLILLQNSKEERKIIKECIMNDLAFLCFNQKSSHVIQKIIKAIKEKDRGYLNNYIINNLIDLCVDANGICIIKEFMSNIKNNYFIVFIINSFEINLETLVIDQYGNFGIQEAIKIFGFYKCSRIIDNIINNLQFYALKKFSSNVIVFLINFLKNKNFSKLLQVIKIIFNEKYKCNNNISNSKTTKNKLKNSIYQKMISNQYAIYIIFTIIQILNEVNMEFFKNIANKEKYVNFNNNEFANSDNEEDEKIIEENIIYNKEKSDIINNINYINNYNNIPFEEYENFKKGILLYIENNTQNKYKKKLLHLMKINKIENNFINLKK